MLDQLSSVLHEVSDVQHSAAAYSPKQHDVVRHLQTIIVKVPLHLLVKTPQLRDRLNRSAWVRRGEDRPLVGDDVLQDLNVGAG